MEIRNRVFEKYSSFRFRIPLNGTENVFVKQSTFVKIGDKLFERKESTLKKSLYLPKVLKCKELECNKYVTRVDGEYVEQGEVVAQISSKGGLSVTQMVTPVSGLMDLSRIDKGYIDILGEEKDSVFESNFDGFVEIVNPNDGLVINSSAVSVDLVSTTKVDGSFFGKLDILSDGRSIVNVDSLEQDYRGKVVWVGPYLYKKVALEIFERGAIAILTYAMSYDEFRDIGLPIAVLGGFGAVHCDMQITDRLIKLKDSLVVLDAKENQLFVVGNFDMDNRDWFVDQYINQKVISRSISHYGYIGRVVDIHEDSDHVMVDFDNKGTVLVHLGQLEFVDL